MGDELKRLDQREAARRRNLDEWRKSRLHELRLPSGLEVVVRDVSMTDLMFSGELPAGILAIAEEAGKEGAESIDLQKVARNAADFDKMLNTLVKMALVEPQIGAEADATHILLGELGADDKMAVYNFVNREVTALSSFREEAEQPVAAALRGGGVRAEAEQLPEAGDGDGRLGAG